MAKIENSDDTKCSIRSEKRYLSYTVGENEWKMAQLPWKTARQLHTKLNMKLAYNPAFVYMGIYPREMETGPQKNLYTNIHSRFICNNQKLEMTQKSIKGE